MNPYPPGRGGTTAYWALGSTLSPTDLAWLALGVYNSLDGVNGGTYALANPLIIGGSGGVQFTTVATTFYGITVANGATFNGNAAFNAQTSIVGSVTQIGASPSDSLTVLATTLISGNMTWGSASTATFEGYAHFLGNVAIDGGTSGSHKSLSFGSYVNVSVNSTWTFEGTSTVTYNVAPTFSQGSTFSGGTVSLATATTVSSTFTLASGGKFLERVLQTSGNASVAPGVYDLIYLESAVARTVTITGSWSDGESLTIRSAGGASHRVTGPGSLDTYVHDTEWIRLTWSTGLSAFVMIGGTTPIHAS